MFMPHEKDELLALIREMNETMKNVLEALLDKPAPAPIGDAPAKTKK